MNPLSVADDKADPLVKLQLHQTSVLQYFLEMADSMDHQNVLRQAVFFSSYHSGCTVMANREGGQVAGKLVPLKAPNRS